MISVSDQLLARRKHDIVNSKSATRTPPVLSERKGKGGVIQLVNLEEKKQITKDLNERFTKAAVVFVTDYKGLDVARINDLRRRLTANTRLQKIRFSFEQQKEPMSIWSKTHSQVRMPLL